MHPILDSQWGFNQASPLLLQLLATVDNWLRICDEGGEIGGLFFDIQKAFDLVPHEALMAKLQQAGLNSNILGNYLCICNNGFDGNGVNCTSKKFLWVLFKGRELSPTCINYFIIHYFVESIHM